MARLFMGGDFRAIRRAPAPVEEQPDPRLALVDLFAGTQVFRPEGAQTSGVIDLSGDAPDYSGLFVGDAQEPAGEPQTDETQSAPAEPEAAAEPEQEAENEDTEPPAPAAPQDEKDYDPIAAVLG